MCWEKSLSFSRIKKKEAPFWFLSTRCPEEMEQEGCLTPVCWWWQWPYGPGSLLTWNISFLLSSKECHPTFKNRDSGLERINHLPKVSQVKPNLNVGYLTPKTNIFTHSACYQSLPQPSVSFSKSFLWPLAWHLNYWLLYL